MAGSEARYEADFFVSHRGSCTAAAKEVADILEAAGYSVIVKHYDFALSDSFVQDMHNALTRAEHLVVLYSDDYDKSPYTMAEFNSFWAASLQGGGRRVVLIRVEDCVLRGLFAGQTFADLATLTDPAERRDEVLRAAQGQAPLRRPEAPVVIGLPTQNLHFVGRTAELFALNVGFMSPQTEAQAITQAALHGLGGIGKSSLAAAYGHSYGFLYSGIVWLNAESEVGYLEGLARLGERLDPRLVDITDLPEKKRLTLGLIERRTTQKPVLLIFDNLPSAADLRDKTPARGAHVLITSRSALWGGGVKALPIDVLSPEASVTLLTSRSGVSDPEGAGALALTLGHLPLALDQAAATVAAEGLSFAGYGRNLQRYLDQTEESADYPNSVAFTVHEALASAVKREPLVGPVMQMLSFMAPDPLPIAVLDGLGEDRGKVVRALQKVSLIRLDRDREGDALLILHRLTQMVLRHALTEGRAEVFAAAVRAVQGPMPADMTAPRDRNLTLTLAPHHAALSAQEEVDLASHVRLRWMSVQVGDAYRVLGLSALAKAAQLRGLHHAETLAQSDSSNVGFQLTLLVSCNRLGDLASVAGDAAGTRAWHEKCLKIAEDLVRADPGNVGFQRGLATSCERLGDLARDAGDPAGARVWFEKGLRIREDLLRVDPGNVGFQRELSVTGNKLGDLARDAGDAAGARGWYEKGLQIREDLVRADPENVVFQRDLAVSCNKLGDLALDAGDTAAARGWYEKGLPIQEDLVRADPGNVGFQRDLILSLWRLAAIAVEPVANYQRALQISLDLQSTGRLAPRDAYFVDTLRDLLAKAQRGE